MFITGPPNKTPIVYVYPALRKPSYYTYYLLGLEEVFGKRSLRFSCDGFPKFYEHGLALRFLVADDVERRVFISAGDGPGMNTKALAWCHRYAKVNLDPEVVPAHGREKVVPIGPSFGLRPSNLPNSITHTLLNLWHSPTLSYAGTRHHLAHFWAQWRRLPQEAYCPTDSRADSDYIFFAGTLWKEEDATNRFRAAFIEVARSAPGVEFEGGFAPPQRC